MESGRTPPDPSTPQTLRMTRVARYQIAYVVVFLILSALSAGLLTLAGWSRGAVIAAALVLLVPGRIQGLLFRDLFRGRVELDRGNPPAALEYFQRFLQTIQAQPWRKPALRLGWSFYTPSVEAMTHNNIGSAEFALGATARAAAAWQAALTHDPLYPLPYANLALVAAQLGDAATTAEHLATARRLGYSATALDRVIHQTQSLWQPSNATAPRSGARHQ